MKGLVSTVCACVDTPLFCGASETIVMWSVFHDCTLLKHTGHYILENDGGQFRENWRSGRGCIFSAYFFINCLLHISINYTNLYAHARTVDTRRSSPIFQAAGYKAKLNTELLTYKVSQWLLEYRIDRQLLCIKYYQCMHTQMGGVVPWDQV